MKTNMSCYKLSFLLVVSLFFTSAYAAQYIFPTDAHSAGDIEQDLLRKGPEIVALADITEGMVVADVLGGGGYYSEIISHKVGLKGQVHLHNNNDYMSYIEKQLVARLKDNRLPNVIRHDREVEDLDLSASHFDAIFFVLGYHDLYYKSDGWNINKDDFIKQIASALKPNGTFVIVEHWAIEGSNTQY